MGTVLSAHELALEHGGRPGIRSLDDILSAIGRPYHGYHRSIYRKAAALHEALATCHGFIDGNKRTAVLVTDLMVALSGYILVPADENEDFEQAFEDFTVAVVDHEYTFDQMVEWFKARIGKTTPIR